jgi:hypothetical protein
MHGLKTRCSNSWAEFTLWSALECTRRYVDCRRINKKWMSSKIMPRGAFNRMTGQVFEDYTPTYNTKQNKLQVFSKFLNYIQCQNKRTPSNSQQKSNAVETCATDETAECNQLHQITITIIHLWPSHTVIDWVLRKLIHSRPDATEVSRQTQQLNYHMICYVTRHGIFPEWFRKW